MSEKPANKPRSCTSGIELKPYYTAADIPEHHRPNVDVAPGEAQFHRGFHTSGYRSKPWRIFQLSGFGKPEDENERIKFLLKNGETGLFQSLRRAFETASLPFC